ncbi:hypothetical protein FRC02_002339 [Tulasnella sp. 418]|nr:hypothetical protein FRC02_002339 [Tulasnella sp. 418]
MPSISLRRKSEDSQQSMDRSLQGHPGHLTTEQEKALMEFKRLLIDAGLYSPGCPEDQKRPSHDDSTLLRFLRARRFVPAKALKQFSDEEKWRKDNDVDELYKYIDVEEFEETKKFYPTWIGRRDKQGWPIYVYKLNRLPEIMDQWNSFTPEQRFRRMVVLYELMTRLMFGLCSSLPNPSYPTPITGTASIIDLEGVSFSLMWGLRNHLQQASELANQNYPETLGVVFVVNAPSFFGTVWGWAKGWFDEATRRKIHILSKSSENTLQEYIDKENIPKEYGGDLDWTFPEEPNLDEPAKKALASIGGGPPRGPYVWWEGEAKRPNEVEDVTLEYPTESGSIDERSKGVATNGIPVGAAA